MPDFESMTTQDATHFTMRTVIAMGEINGHANLAMELCERRGRTRSNTGARRRSPAASFAWTVGFQLDAQTTATVVNWQGEVTLGGMLAMMAGHLLDTMGRQNFDRMAERLQLRLQPEPLAASESRRRASCLRHPISRFSGYISLQSIWE